MEKGKLEGKEVTLVREARQGDRGFDESKNQVLIEYEDGTQQVVDPELVYGRKKNVPSGGSGELRRGPATPVTSTKK